MTVAQVHPTLLENNGYKTTPIKTTFSQNHVKYQHWWQLVNQVFLTQRRSVPPAAEQWRSSGVSDGRYSVVKVKAVLGGSRWQMHTPTHIMWILGNQNEEQEGGGSQTSPQFSLLYDPSYVLGENFKTSKFCHDGQKNPTFQDFAAVIFLKVLWEPQGENDPNFWQLSILWHFRQ